MRTTSKIAAIAAGLVLAGGATAAAVSAPDAAQTGLTNATEHSGAEQLPASHDDHPGGEPAAPDAADHGTDVSETAKATESGPGKGAVVSAVASDGRAGGSADKGAAVDTPNDGGLDTGTQASGGANATGAEHASDQAAAGSANAGDHGKP